MSNMANRKLSHMIRAWAVEARDGLDDHPENDTLLAYYDGELGTLESESLRDHLALCPDCSQRGLDLALFSRTELADDGEVDAQETEQDSAATHRPLSQASRPAAPREARPAMPLNQKSSWRFLWQPGLGYAAAALFLICGLGGSLRLVHLLAESKLPRLDVQVVDLQPIGSGALRDVDSRRSASEAAVDAPLLLVLYLLDPGTYDRYRVEIWDASLPGADAIWSTDDLKRHRDDDFMVLLPPDSLREGRYHVRLYGVEGGQLDPMAEYALRTVRR